MTDPFEPDAGVRAQRAAEAHLEACEAAEEAFEEALMAGDSTDIDSPACAPYDGCSTCVVREVLFAGWPVFTEDAVGRLRAAGFTDAADLLAADVPPAG